jgi:2-phospho-L-lactate guanylyltransferase
MIRELTRMNVNKDLLIHAVVPIKTLQSAKSRLAGMLAANERRALVLAMLADVLAALRAAPSLGQVYVASRDPAVLAAAAEAGAAALFDQAADLNGALAQAAGHAVTHGAAALLVVPGDLPLLMSVDVERLVAALPAAPGVVLAPARDGGTNALLARPPAVLPFRFGSNSLGLHLEAAQTLGIAARIVHTPGLAWDVDRPEDLAALAEVPGEGAAQRLVRSLGIHKHAACA